MDKKLLRFLPLLVVPVLVLVFYLKCLNSLDPDFGWHYQMGHLILASGIPKTDPFSYTMPSFLFVDHEWFDDVAIFILYSYFGYPILALGFALIAAAALIVAAPIKKGLYFIIPLLLAAGTSFTFVGIRPQLISWLFFAILVRLLFLTSNWQKTRLFLPLLFFAWANLHGGFALGIGIFIFFLAVKLLQERQFNLADSAVAAASVTVTFINPYHQHLWTEVLRSVTDNSLRSSVMEWQPAFSEINLTLLLLLGLSLPLIAIYQAKIPTPVLTTYLGVGLFGLSSLRNLPFFAIFSMVPLTLAFENLAKAAKKNKESSYRLAYFSNLVAAVVTIFCSVAFLQFLSGKSPLALDLFYPVNAVKYLKSHPHKGHIFADYNWGGYLIWQLPSEKTFVDGRMPSWRFDNPPPGESSNAFADYQKIKSGSLPFPQVADKYDIGVVLWPNLPSQNPHDLFWQLAQAIFPSPPSKEANFPDRLDPGVWKKVYADNKALIYVKQNLNSPASDDNNMSKRPGV